MSWNWKPVPARLPEENALTPLTPLTAVTAVTAPTASTIPTDRLPACIPGLIVKTANGHLIYFVPLNLQSTSHSHSDPTHSPNPIYYSRFRSYNFPSPHISLYEIRSKLALPVNPPRPWLQFQF
jgi:hypothetical protein